MKIAILAGGALRVLGVVNAILSRPEVFEQPCYSDDGGRE